MGAKRLTNVRLDEDERVLLESLAAMHRTSMTAVIVRGLRLLAIVDRCVRSGGQVVLIDAEGQQRRLRPMSQPEVEG